jgi:ABC-type nitrate/sulfonate/bicarbonate transport system permease component
MSVSLLESLWITFIKIIPALFLSTAIGIFLGWVLTKKYRTIKTFKILFQLLIYLIALLPTIYFALTSEFAKYKISVFPVSIFLCGFVFTTFYAIIGFEQARQNQNQWYLAIPNISLGMRIGLILSWPALKIDILLPGGGNDISFFLWQVFNYGDKGGFALALFSIIILAFILDQFIDLSSIFLIKYLGFNHNSHRNY